MSRLGNIAQTIGHRVRNFLFSWDAVAYALFVVVASGLWYAHALGSFRDMTLHVPVTYTGVPQDVSFEPELPDHIDITIRDAGSRLISQQQEVPTLTFDLSKQFKSSKGEGNIHISREQIQQLLPPSLTGSGTAKIRSISPENIDGAYKERYTEKVFTLKLDSKGGGNGELILFPPEVQVVARMSLSNYSKISEKDLHVYCPFPREKEDKLTVHCDVLNGKSKLISNLRITPSEVEYIIEKK